MGTRGIDSSSVLATMTYVLSNILSDGVKTSLSDTLGVTLTATPSSGTATGQADRGWSEYAKDLADGATVDLDVYDFAGWDVGAGDGKDALGLDLTLAEIVGLLVYNAGPGYLTFRPKADATGFDECGEHTVGPGGFVHIYEPADPAHAVADGTNHVIEFEAETGLGACEFQVHLLGRSA